MTAAQPRPLATATQIAAEVRAGRRSAREVVEQSLARIRRDDEGVRTFVEVRWTQALAEADALDAGGLGHDGLLAGVPVAVKDAFDVAGMVTGHGGRGNSTPAAADDEVVARLRAAGAIIVGRTAMPEFGQFPITESLAHGRTHNPWNLAHSAGGSSGGSAAAVAAGMVPIATGSDGGGSIRIPASACGLVGLKAEPGLVPAEAGWYGLISAGAITRTVADQALVLDVLAGANHASFVAQLDQVPPLRVGWTLSAPVPGLQPSADVARVAAALGRRLAAGGHAVRQIEVRWPNPTAGFFMRYLAGMRDDADAVEHPELLEPRTLSTARAGRLVSPGLARWGQRDGARVARRIDRLFDDFDVIVLPTLFDTTPLLGQLDGMGSARAMLTTVPMVGNTAGFNHSGHPVLVIPAGMGPGGLPIGVQLIGPFGGEARLLALAAQLEALAPWPGLAPAYR